MKNFQLPLPEATYTRLRAEAKRMKVPATTLAREAVEVWLQDQSRKSRHEAITAWATEMAGTSLELGEVLEAAGIECLTNTGRKPIGRPVGPDFTDLVGKWIPDPAFAEVIASQRPIDWGFRAMTKAIPG